MTSKISLTKIISNFIKENSWLVIVSATLTSICTLIPLMLNMVADKGDVNPYNYIYGNVFLGLVGIVLGVLNAIVVFKYLNTKMEVDFYHSLPMTRTQMFVKRYVSGIVAFVVPFVLITGVTLIIGLMTTSGDNANAVKYLLNVVISFLATYAYASLGTIITGNIFMSICVSMGVMNFPWVWVSIYNSMKATYLDFYYYDSTVELMVAKAISPIVVATTGIFGYYYSVIVEFQGALIITALVVSVIAYLCYKVRESENASNPIAVEVFKPIIKVIGVMSASGLGGLLVCTITNRNQNVMMFLIGALITGLIVHVAFEMLYEMDVKAGFKRLYQFVIMYVVIVVGVILVSFGVLGFSDRIADIDEIKSIEYLGVEITNRESIEILHNYMQSAIDVKNGKATEYQVLIEDSQRRNYSWILVTVNLENESYTRYYNGLELLMSDVIKIETNEEFVKKAFGYDYEINELESILDKAVMIEAQGSVYFDIEKEKFIEIYKTLQTEVEKLTPEYLEKNLPVISLRVLMAGNRVITIPVYDVQKETLEKIEPVSVEYTKVRIDRGYESVESSEEEQKEIIEKMTKSYGTYYTFGNMHRQDTDIFYVYDEYYNIVGYISEEEILEITNK